MASLAPKPSLLKVLFEPIRGLPLVAGAIAVWLAGAGYCHGYQQLLAGESPGPWSGSLLWSAFAVVPWFALFEWSKEPRGAEATRRPALLVGLVLAIATLSIGLEYLVDFCIGDVTDSFELLVMRRMPAIAFTVLLIAITRKAVLRRAPSPAAVELRELAEAIDWVEAADNYVEVHSGGTVTLRRMTMRDAATELERHGFVRIHRRYLVNRSRIHAIGERSVTLPGGRELPVGTAFAANLRGGT
jgi:hypothetical protein